MKSADDDDALPSWCGVGRKLHWWSESQKKNMLVRVTKVDEIEKKVIVTFEIDQKVWKSVPFTKIGRKDCPLRNPADEKTSEGAKSDAATQAKADGSGAKKRKRENQDRSATPDAFSKEGMRALAEQKAKREQLAIQKKIEEEERKKEERRRQELVEADKRRVAEAFEKRKKEAEAQKLKEEEEWRQNLIKRREKEAAEEAEREKEKEERRKKRREEKAKKEEEERKKAEAKAKAEGRPIVVPPKAGLGQPQVVPPLPVTMQAAMAQPMQAVQAMQMPAAVQAMQMMAMRQQAGGVTADVSALAAQAQAQAHGGVPAWSFGDLSGMVGNTASGSASFGGAGVGAAAQGAWAPFANGSGQVQPSMLPGMGAGQMMQGMGATASNPGAAQFGHQWSGMPQGGGGAWNASGNGNFQVPWNNG